MSQKQGRLEELNIKTDRGENLRIYGALTFSACNFFSARGTFQVRGGVG